ncbi:HtaA domain-containing protein [Streptomyces sirii]|uniref:HtaA domain-containing protein n=1 Tax=Streptomyces sirii TaxID=3127701 RepID=UPI003D3651A7
MYQEGQQLDPATVSVTPGAAPEGPRPTDPATPKPPTRTKSKPSPSGSGADTPPADHRPAPAPSATPRVPVVNGRLDWGVKKSFRDYVTGPIGGGRAQLAGGATLTAAGYRFPKGHGAYDAAKSTLTAGFHGSVRFLAHSGALDLTFRNLSVRVEGTKGTLLADVSAKSRDSGRITTTDDLPVAALTLPAGAPAPNKGVLTLDQVPAKLTARGAEAFDRMYRPGQALDPVTLAVSLNDDAPLPPARGGSPAPATGPDASSPGSRGATFTSGDATTGGELAATGSTAPTGALLISAAALVAAGSAATYAGRRRTSR